MRPKIIINRSYTIDETFGNATFLDILGNPIFNFVTLELPSKGNKKKMSCINEETYLAKVWYSDKYKCKTLRLEDKNGRENVLMHPLNYAAGVKIETEGCIGPGEGYTDINKDGYLDVTSSGKTLKKIIWFVESQDPIHKEVYIEITSLAIGDR